ncbi:zinc-binding dehydrogenase [Nakamurella sp. PAMC28650]|uniref:zinc-dependent alcohol dehydrogenase n=1 Tax=Nakamurella sp. PAMC28650 TaxID=2762325 RepID=UPI001C9ADB21|nr:alcohol dehydrogenase catalytic domain-containing protein [Nakamurella sp. PAMC28650]
MTSPGEFLRSILDGPQINMMGIPVQALVLKKWWDLAVEVVPDPVMGSGDVLIDVLATGICGSDIHGFTGENGRRVPGQVMGHETVGRIAGVGADTGAFGLSIGDLVTVNPVIGCGVCDNCRSGQDQNCPDKVVIGVAASYSSAFAQQMAVPAANVVVLPASMPVAYGALVEPLAVGYHALRRGGCSESDRVLVVGGGPIGQACVLAAQRLGAAAVVVSEPDEHRRDLIGLLGAATVDPGGADASELPSRVAAALGGRPTIVVDAVGLGGTMETAFACAPLGAVIVLVGMGSVRLDLASYEISVKERSVVGSFCYDPEEFRQTAAWVGTSPPVLAHLIDQHVSMDSAATSFTALARGESRASKILVYPNVDTGPVPGVLR